MIETELDAHLDTEKRQKTKEGNYRDGHQSKEIKSSLGESEIKVPRDRDGSFEFNSNGNPNNPDYLTYLMIFICVR